jgi:hypothetical protein
MARFSALSQMLLSNGAAETVTLCYSLSRH